MNTSNAAKTDSILLQLETKLENTRNRLQVTIEELESQNKILESIFANTHFLLAYMDRRFNFIRVNQAYADASGRSAEYFEGKNHFDLYPNDENRGIFTRVLETGEPFSVKSKPFVYPDYHRGETTYWNWSLQPIKNRDGDVEGLVLGLVDVTEEKQAKVDKQASEKSYRELKESSIDGYARTDIKGRIIDVNKAFQGMTGYSEAELLEMTFEELTPEKWHEMERAMVDRAFDTGYTPLYEKEYTRKNGDVLPVELRTYSLSDKHGRPTGLWAFVRDISLRKAAEEQMKINAEALEQTNQALQDFVYFASHDLNEPLRKIVTFGRMLADRKETALEDTGREYLDRMINASERMRHLIQELLTFSKLSNRDVAFTPLNLNDVIRDAVSNLEIAIQNSGCTIDVKDLPEISADATAMLQLFQNLLSNAIKFQSPGNAPRVKVDGCEVHITGKEVEGKNQARPYVEIAVRDNGIGLDEKYINDIFGPFKRLHTRADYEGVGMGLAICKKIVERHGGEISANNNFDGGTTFTIRLPKHPDRQARQ